MRYILSLVEKRFFVFLTAVFAGLLNVSAYEISHREILTVVNEKLFIRDVEITGTLTETESVGLIYSEFENIEAFDLSHKVSGKDKWKSVKPSEISTSDLPTNSFFDDYKIRRAVLPKNTSYNLKAIVRCSDLMLLSSFDLANEDVLFLTYELHLPLDYQVQFFFPENVDSFTYRIDSVFTEKEIVYTITSHGDMEESKYNQRIRCTVHKSSQSAEAAFYNWIQDINTNTTELNDDIKSELDKLLESAQSDEQIAKILFEYVQSQVRYVAIEKAYGKWAFRSPNDVVLNKRGDCKDMANLLTSALKYKGLDAHNALIHSLSVKGQDFVPTLEGANHAITICYINQKQYVLDATDASSVFGYPSRHTQGQQFWQMDDQKLGRVPIVSETLNKKEYLLELQFQNDTFQGQFDLLLYGFHAIRFLEDLRSTVLTEEVYIADFLANRISMKVRESSLIKLSDTSIVLSCKVIGGVGAARSAGGRIYINANVLIPMQRNIYRKEELPSLSYYTLKEDYTFRFKFQKEVTLVDGESFNEMNRTHFSGVYGISSKDSDPKSLDLNYSLSIKTLLIDDSNYEEANEVITEFNTQASKYISLELK